MDGTIENILACGDQFPLCLLILMPNTMTTLHYYRSLPSSMKSVAFPPQPPPLPSPFLVKYSWHNRAVKHPFMFLKQGEEVQLGTLLYIG